MAQLSCSGNVARQSRTLLAPAWVRLHPLKGERRTGQVLVEAQAKFAITLAGSCTYH